MYNFKIIIIYLIMNNKMIIIIKIIMINKKNKIYFNNKIKTIIYKIWIDNNKIYQQNKTNNYNKIHNNHNKIMIIQCIIL